MRTLPITDFQEALRFYHEEELDPEFIPYIQKINRLEAVISCQSCIGHMPYKGLLGPPPCHLNSTLVEVDPPKEHSDHWGYLLLYMTPDVFQFLNDHYSDLRNKNWFWGGASNWDHPAITPNGSFMVAFAWDARHWPQPAKDITEALEKSVEYLKRA